MTIKRITVGAAIVFTLGIAATPSLAGSNVFVSGAPNPSVTGQSVTVTTSVMAATSNTMCSVTVTDTTNAAPVCSGPITFTTDVFGAGSGTCTHTFATAGTRTVQASYSGCDTASNSYSQIVNAAAISVPTMAEWSLWGVTGILVLGGAAIVARRARRDAV